MSVKRVTTLSMLVSLAVIGRIYMTFIPNVQPVTAIIILTSAFLGMKYGVITASLTIIVSNMYISFGIWTLPQIFMFSFIAIIAGFIPKITKNNVTILSIFGFISGYLFGLLMSLYNYLIFGVFLGYYLTGLPFDTNHAIGNLLMVAILYKPLKNILTKVNNNDIIY